MRQAGKAAAQATAMIRTGVPEGEAIATANRQARRAEISEPTHEERTYRGKGVRGHGAKSATGKTRSYTGR